MNRRTLENLPVFRGISREAITKLAILFQREQYASDQIIFHQGDPANRLHILQSGQVEIRLEPHDGEMLTVSRIESGGIFGWSAALGRRDYTSDAVAVQAGEGLSIRGDDLRSFCQENPESGILLLERLAEVISSRLRNTHAKVVELLQTNLAADER